MAQTIKKKLSKKTLYNHRWYAKLSKKRKAEFALKKAECEKSWKDRNPNYERERYANMTPEEKTRFLERQKAWNRAHPNYHKERRARLKALKMKGSGCVD